VFKIGNHKKNRCLKRTTFNVFWVSGGEKQRGRAESEGKNIRVAATGPGATLLNFRRRSWQVGGLQSGEGRGGDEEAPLGKEEAMEN